MKKIIILLLATLFIFTSCDDSKVTPKINPEESKLKTEAANAAFSDVLLVMKDKDIEEASDMDDMDFESAYNLYNEGVTADPSNLDAQLGAAVSRILSLLKDPEFIKLRNAWWNADDNFNLDNVSLSESRLRLSAFINNALLPAVDYSLERLAILDTFANKDYTYIITPGFYGESIEGDSYELDMTEIKLFHAILLGVKAGINVSQAYKIDLADYSLEGIKNALTKGSDFLTLLNASKMITAHSKAKEAVDKALEAMNFLLTEDDDQDNDILRNTNDNISDINDFKKSLLKVKDILNNSYELKMDNVTLTLNVSNFFNNAPEDLKALFPNYTVTIVDDELSVKPEAEDRISLVFPDTTFGGLLEGNPSQEDIKLFLDIYECTENVACYGGDSYYHCTEDFTCEYGEICSDDSSCDDWSHCSDKGYCEYGTRCADNSECSDWEHCSENNICEYGAVCSDDSECDTDYEMCSLDGYCIDLDYK
jgi:hypothetical protein